MFFFVCLFVVVVFWSSVYTFVALNSYYFCDVVFEIYSSSEPFLNSLSVFFHLTGLHIPVIFSH